MDSPRIRALLAAAVADNGPAEVIDASRPTTPSPVSDAQPLVVSLGRQVAQATCNAALLAICDQAVVGPTERSRADARRDIVVRLGQLIRVMRTQAAARGQTGVVALCDRALAGRPKDFVRVVDAILALYAAG